MTDRTKELVEEYSQTIDGRSEEEKLKEKIRHLTMNQDVLLELITVLEKRVTRLEDMFFMRLKK